MESQRANENCLHPTIHTEPSPQTPEWCMISSASPRVGPEHSPQTPEWSMTSATAKQFPPIQAMGRPVSGYDPNRIPSSVFNSKSTTPMEWSVASNESLFSIQMGNNSFSIDHMILSGKSQELLKPDELINFTPTPSQQPVSEAKFNELGNSPSSLRPLIETAANNPIKSESLVEEKPEVKEEVHEKLKVVVEEAAKDHSKEIASHIEGARISKNASNVSDGKEMPPVDGGRPSASTPRLSDESGTSSNSFAFPVLGGEGGKSSSVKVAPENLQAKPPEKPQQLQPQSHPEQAPPPVTPKTAEITSWFSCFTCRLPCC